MLDLSKHFSLTSSQDVNAICHPILDNLGITYFNYLKVHHNDSSRELLTNNAEWIDHFYQQKLYKSIGAIDIEHLLPKGFFLWSELNGSDPIYSQGREIFNIDNGISFVIKRADVTYLYIFGSTRDNTKINHFYTRHIDLLKRFILYFREKASTLILQAEKNRIYLPEKQIIDPHKLKQHQLTTLERKHFYKTTDIEKYYLFSEADNLYLTRKQAECVAFLMEGATAKQCAKALHLSYRTVEGYWNDIKNKLSTVTGKKFTKEKLISYLKDTAIYDGILPDKICVAND